MKNLLILLSIAMISCNAKQDIDLIVYNGTIYTVDEAFSKKDAMAINEGKIIETGNYSELSKKYKAKEGINLEGKFIYPGFYDGHCHFLGYGLSLQQADLVGTKSFNDVIQKLVEHDKKYNTEWVTGRGWDQNDWPEKKFPTNELLDKAFPDKPVYISRIDGHAAIANTVAMQKAGVTTSTKVAGGDLITEKGVLTGVLVDNAMGLIAEIIPKPTKREKEEALLNAQVKCFAVGLTSVAEAGLAYDEVNIIQNLHNSDTLKMRIYAMLSPTSENIENHINKGITVNDKLSVRSIKLFADGALGSRGALMLSPYADDPGNYGLLMEDKSYFDKICQLALENNYQVNTHCIGDSANRFILNTYGEVLKGENDKRWRIEHSQIINPEDFQLFKKYSVIPSIQATHATSDMYWAEERLGTDRMEGAYAYKTLLNQNGWLVNGSDFPVESINPMLTFYAAVARQNFEKYPEGGFRAEEGLTREEALRSITIWPAKGGFEEKIKGSLEAGKVADFVILDEDLMDIDIYEVPKIKIKATYIDGKRVY